MRDHNALATSPSFLFVFSFFYFFIASPFSASVCCRFFLYLSLGFNRFLYFRGVKKATITVHRFLETICTNYSTNPCRSRVKCTMTRIHFYYELVLQPLPNSQTFLNSRISWLYRDFSVVGGNPVRGDSHPKSRPAISDSQCNNRRRDRSDRSIEVVGGGGWGRVKG